MVAVLDALRDLARSDEDRAWLAVCQAIWLFWTLGDREGALSELAVVKRALGAPWDAVVESTAAGLRVQIGEIATAMSMLENIEIDDTAPPAVQLTMHSPLAAGLSLSGRLVDGVERARASVEMALLLGEESTVSMMELLISQYWGMLCLHRYEETAAGARAIADLLAQTEDYEPRALFAGMEARALLFSGRPVTAVDKVANAIRWHGSLSMFGFRPLLHSTRALALVWTGRTEEARAECGEARRWHQPPRPFDAELDLAEAVVLAAEGRRTQASKLAGVAAWDAQAQGCWYYAFVAAYTAVRIQPTAETLAALEAAAPRVDDEASALPLAYGRALVDGDATRLGEAAERAIDSGQHLFALEMLEVALARVPPHGSRPLRDRLSKRGRATTVTV